jgi:hypothetical protein
MEPIQMARSTKVRVSKLIRAPMNEVFAWCTDYSDMDPEIIGSKGSQARRIISRDKRRIVFVDTYSSPAIKTRTAEVSLHPPNEWRAKFSGGRWEGTGTYRLSETKHGTKLDITFTMEKAVDGYSAEVLTQRADETWDAYVAAIEKSLKPTQ